MTFPDVLTWVTRERVPNINIRFLVLSFGHKTHITFSLCVIICWNLPDRWVLNLWSFSKRDKRKIFHMASFLWSLLFSFLFVLKTENVLFCNVLRGTAFTRPFCLPERPLAVCEFSVLFWTTKVLKVKTLKVLLWKRHNGLWRPEGKSIEENKATKFHPYWERKQDLQWVALEFNWIFQLLRICSAMQPASRPWRSKASSTKKLFHLCSLKFFQPVCKSAIPNENEVYRIDAEGVAIIDLSPFDGLQLPNCGLPLAFHGIQFRYFVMGHVMQSCRHTPIQNSKAILMGKK